VVERHLKRICIVQNVDSLYCLRRRNILSEVKVGIPPTNKLVGILPTNFMTFMNTIIFAELDNRGQTIKLVGKGKASDFKKQ